MFIIILYKLVGLIEMVRIKIVTRNAEVSFGIDKESLFVICFLSLVFQFGELIRDKAHAYLLN